MFVHLVGYAQDIKGVGTPSGRIVGNIIDDDTGEPLVRANVVVDKTNIGVETNEDGSYVIETVSPGVYRIRTSYVGYYQQTKDSVRVLPSQTTQLSFLLVNEHPDSTIWVG